MFEDLIKEIGVIGVSGSKHAALYLLGASLIARDRVRMIVFKDKMIQGQI